MSGMKNHYGERNGFNSRKEVMEKSKMALMAIPTIEFQKCFENWIKRWHKCVAVDGECLKGIISLLMNKTYILNFLNEFRELFKVIYDFEENVKSFIFLFQILFSKINIYKNLHSAKKEIFGGFFKMAVSHPVLI